MTKDHGVQSKSVKTINVQDRQSKPAEKISWKINTIMKSINSWASMGFR